MRRAGRPLLSLGVRTALLALGLAALLAALLAARNASPRPLRASSGDARVLVLSDQARRYLALQFRAYATEFMGCMIGDVRGPVVLVRRIAPADVEPAQSTQTRVIPKRTCEEAGWQGTVGVIHSHPGGERCFYFFPGTRVASSDAHSFALQSYSVDAIMCGDSVVWVNRDLVQRKLPLTDRRMPQAGELAPGNRVRDGSRPIVRAEPASVNFVYRKGERLTDVSVRVDLVRAQRQRVPELAERLTELDGVHAVVPHPIAGRLDDENAHGYAMPSLG